MGTLLRFQILLLTLAILLPGSSGCSKGDGDKKDGKSGDEAKARYKTVLALKNMAIGFTSFSAESGRLLPPADGSPAKGKPKLAGMSWRVYLLPYLDEMEVYRKLEEGKFPLAKDAKPADVWNRPDLAKLSGSIFSSPIPGKTKEGWDTFYRVFMGNGAGFEEGKQLHIPKDFPDGTDKTMPLSRPRTRFPGQNPRSFPTIQGNLCRKFISGWVLCRVLRWQCALHPTRNRRKADQSHDNAKRRRDYRHIAPIGGPDGIAKSGGGKGGLI